MSSKDFTNEDPDQEPNLQLILDRYERLKEMQNSLLKEQQHVDEKINKTKAHRKVRLSYFTVNNKIL